MTSLSSSPSLPFCLVVLFFYIIATTRAATPDAEIHVVGVEGGRRTIYYAAYAAGFGSYETVTGTLALPPATVDPRLCDEELIYNTTTTTKVWSQEQNILLLVPRGVCFFEQKALAAQNLGAKAVLIYNTLESRYEWNDTTAVMTYPEPQRDYECQNGQSHGIQNLTLDPPAYNASYHDRYLTLSSPDNLCHLDTPSSQCASQRCLVKDPANKNGSFEGCCAWDIHTQMGPDPTLDDAVERVHIPAVFLTMRQADEFLQFPTNTETTDTDAAVVVVVTIQQRPYPKFSGSSIILWMLAIFIVAFASWYSAKDYRKAKKEWKECIQRSSSSSSSSSPAVRRVQRRGVVSPPPPPPQGERQVSADQSIEMAAVRGVAPSVDLSAVEDTTQSNPEEERSTIASTQGTESDVHDDEEALPPSSQTAISSSPPPPPQDGVAPQDEETPPAEPVERDDDGGEGRSNHQNNERSQEQRVASSSSSGSQPNAFELNAWHAVGFVVVASTFLLVLFYFQIYSWVTVLYAIGCSGTMSRLMFIPGYRAICRRVGFLRHCCFTPVTSSTRCDLNHVQWVDVCAAASAYLVGAMWLYVGFTDENPSWNTFFWITQDVMGACLCIVFLCFIRLNSIKVATILLVVVFIYDIFFVFISPYVFNGESVMVTVATSGGPPEAPEDFCEKYPNEKKCEGGDPLPLVLTIPRLLDYRGGSSLLGLGDIVLPGLLLAFAARVDEAKRLVGSLPTNVEITVPKRWYNGYLFPLTVAYAIGLLMANVAVYLMQRGQPALLYLVPACLGTMLVAGRKELKDLWKGPVVLTYADRILKRRPSDQLSWAVETPNRSVETNPATTEAVTETGSVRSLQ